MLKKNLQNAINDQINKELYASYLYLSMSAYCERNDLSGLATWLRVQSQEEHGHAMKLFDFLLEADGAVVLKAVAAPPAEFASILAVFEQAYEHECKVTASIHALYDLALKEKAYAAQNLLRWFIDEQVEEEQNARKIVAKLALIKTDGGALLAFDRELGDRKS